MQHFPNPEVFDPERFSPEKKDHFNPYVYLPFGAGPHNCIGERFGMIQVKIGLINFLRNYILTKSEKMSDKMEYDLRAMMLQPKGGVYVRIARDPLLEIT